MSPRFSFFSAATSPRSWASTSAARVSDRSHSTQSHQWPYIILFAAFAVGPGNGRLASSAVRFLDSSSGGGAPITESVLRPRNALRLLWPLSILISSAMVRYRIRFICCWEVVAMESGGSEIPRKRLPGSDFSKIHSLEIHVPAPSPVETLAPSQTPLGHPPLNSLSNFFR